MSFILMFFFEVFPNSNFVPQGSHQMRILGTLFLIERQPRTYHFKNHNQIIYHWKSKDILKKETKIDQKWPKNLNKDFCVV